MARFLSRDAQFERDRKIQAVLVEVNNRLVSWLLAIEMEEPKETQENWQEACYEPLLALEKDELARAVMMFMDHDGTHVRQATIIQAQLRTLE